ncbi:hypothetical protein BT69DRAFT_1275399, partial [Atractiella rhizophila]
SPHISGPPPPQHAQQQEQHAPLSDEHDPNAPRLTLPDGKKIFNEDVKSTWFGCVS